MEKNQIAEESATIFEKKNQIAEEKNQIAEENATIFEDENHENVICVISSMFLCSK